MYRSLLLTFLTVLLLFNLSSAAAEIKKESNKLDTTYDWIQLISGEWLKGEIKSITVKELVFDSDQLGLLTFNWNNVKYLQRHNEGNIKIENHASVIKMMADYEAKLQKEEYDKKHNRNTKILFTPAGVESIDIWTTKFALSLNIRSGNTKLIDFTSKLNTRHVTENSRYTLDYIGNFSKTGVDAGKLEETSNSHRITSVLDMYVTKYFFYNPASVEYFRDPFQNIDHRWKYSAGLGYIILDTSSAGWDLSAGPALIGTRYNSVLPGEDEDVSSASFTVSTNVDAELTETIDFIYKYNILLSSKETGGYSHHMIGTLESKILSNLDLDISLVWDRISHPSVSISGRVPETNDYRLLVGISYSF